MPLGATSFHNQYVSKASIKYRYLSANSLSLSTIIIQNITPKYFKIENYKKKKTQMCKALLVQGIQTIYQSTPLFVKNYLNIDSKTSIN